MYCDCCPTRRMDSFRPYLNRTLCSLGRYQNLGNLYPRFSTGTHPQAVAEPGGPAGAVAPLNGEAKHFLPLFESVNDLIQLLLTQYKLQSMVKLLIIPRKTRILHHLTYTIDKLMHVVVTVNIDRSDQSFCSLACASPGL